MSIRIPGAFSRCLGVDCYDGLCFGQPAEPSFWHRPRSIGPRVPKAKGSRGGSGDDAPLRRDYDGRGEYHLLGLPTGQYVLTVGATGFRTYRQSGVVLRLADRTSIDVALEVGQPAQSLNVTAAAPLLQTQTAR